jgi:probable HAF family extracellular repeat protein/uncharacterized repeat protein (TIGR03803 family)
MLGGGYGATASVIPNAHGDTISVPDAELLFNGDFRRAGPDLVLTGHDGRHHLIPGYFSGDKKPALVAPNGASLSPDLVDLLAGSPAPGQYAQAQQTTPPDAIGKVEKAVGNVTAIRNGVAVALHVGDPVFKSDVIQTGSNSSAGIGFPDGTALNLIANTRMALNDYSYDPNGTSNVALVSLVQGTFAFVAGRVAHTGDMKIETPVATMGIRGTTGWVQEIASITANLGNVSYSFAVVDDFNSTGHGQYDLIDANGNIIATVSQTGYVTYVTPQGVGQQPLVSTEPMTNSQVGFEQQIIQQVFGVLNSINNPNPNPQSTPGTPGSSTPPNQLNELPHLLQEGAGQPFAVNIPLPGPSGTTNVSSTVTISTTTPQQTTENNSPTATVSWTSTTGGDWNDPANWSDALAPLGSQNVDIFLPVKVTIDDVEEAASLVIGAGGILNIIAGGELIVANGISNSGVLQLNSSGGDPQLVIDGTVYLLDGGTIEFKGPAAQNVITGFAGSGATLVNVDNTIEGSGAIGQGDGALTLVNGSLGTIDATPLIAGDSGVLTINTGNTVSNSGLLEATAGGTLQIEDAINNLGTIKADGGTVNIADSTNAVVQNSGLIEAIDGGTIFITGYQNNASSGTIEAVGAGSTITANLNNGDSGNYGAVEAIDGGTFNINIDVTVNPTGNGGNYGTIEALDGGTVNYTGEAAANFDTVEANGPDATVNIELNAFINAGTIAADGGGAINIDSSTIYNSNVYSFVFDGSIVDGLVEVGAASHIYLDSATILQGFVTIESGGEIDTVAGTSNTIDTANGQHNLSTVTINIESGGTLAVADGSSLTLASPDAIDNAGTIELNSTGDATTLYFDQPFAGINGSGNITLSDNSGNVIAATQAGDQLTNFDNTISGAGTIGNGGLVLVNDGIINADGANALTLDPTSLTNTGTVEATNGATLALSNTVLNNSGSTLEPGTSYFSSDFDAPSAYLTTASAMNDAGAVVGTYDTDERSYGFLYDNGAFTTLAGPAGAQGLSVAGINNSGEVVGTYGSYGFVYSDGAYATLNGPVGASDVSAVGINNAGEVVGQYSNDGSTFSFIYSGGAYTTLNPSVDAQDVFVHGINNTGQAFGSFVVAGGASYGFIYDDGAYAILKDPLASTADFVTQPLGINDAGEVVGYYQNAGGLAHGFVYGDGGYTTLDDPFAVNGTYLTGVNNAGEIVGYYVDAGGATHGFIYENGGFTNLPSDDTNPVAINNAGQIAGTDQNGDNSPGFVSDPGASTSGAITAAAGSTIDLDNATVIGGNVTVAAAGDDLPAGVIDATAGQSFVIGASITNDGTIEATGPGGGDSPVSQDLIVAAVTAPAGTLVLEDATIANSNGTISASGTGASLMLEGTSVTGGTLETSGGGLIEVENGTTTLTDVTISTGSVIDVVGGGTLTLDTGNTITNHGLLEATYSGTLDVQDGTIDNMGTGADGIVVDGTSTLLVDTATLQLTGGGDVSLASGSQIIENADSPLLTGTGAILVLDNNNNTISGAGTIGSGDGHLALTNETHGVIDATGGTLSLDTGNTVITNAGTLEASAGSTLEIINGTVANTGTIELNGSGAAVGLEALVSFNGANGVNPYAGVAMDAAGDLFGTTSADGDGADGAGTVFEIAKTGGSYASTPTTLASFNGTDGANPTATVIADAAGDLFGETGTGGANGDGTVFELVNNGGGSYTPTTLVSFNGIDGADPTVVLTADAAGDLFGATYSGGASGDGTVFEITKTGGSYATTPTTLLDFDGTNGANPITALVADAAGDIFGTTQFGGANGDGAVFELMNNGGGSYTPITLLSFNGANGTDPITALVIDPAGDIFGTTEFGGAHGRGTVFELVNSGGGSYTPITLLSFNGTNGANPNTGLMADAAGDIFGTTSGGGANGDGTVFELVNNGGGSYTLTTLASFDGTNGSEPATGLVADAAGDLFGTTLYGGANGDGTVFELSGAPIPAQLEISGSLTLNGGGGGATGPGQVILTDSSENFIVSNGSAATLYNVDNTISGAGTIGDAYLTLDNETHGVIDATGTNNPLILDTGANAIINAGLLEATGGGTLDIDSAVSNSGTLEANGAGSTVSIGEYGFNSGLIEAVGGGTVSFNASPSDSASVTNASGDTIEATGVGSTVFVGVSGHLTDINAGLVEAIDGGTVSFIGNAGGINEIGGTIEATGTGSTVSIAAARSNHGLIEAADGGTVSFGVVGDDQNYGTIEATGAGSTVSAFGGEDVSSNYSVIEAADGGAVSISGNFANDGTLEATGGTVSIEVGATTNEAGGIVEATGNGSTLTLSETEPGSTNDGTIEALDGGAVTINHEVTNNGDGTYTAATATNESDGVIEADDGTLTLNGLQGDANAGTMEAVHGGSFTINVALNPDYDGSGGGNTGTMEALSGGTLAIIGDMLNASGATIKAVGCDSTVDFSNNTNFTNDNLIDNGGTILAAHHGAVSFDGVEIGNNDGTIAAYGSGSTVQLSNVGIGGGTLTTDDPTVGDAGLIQVVSPAEDSSNVTVFDGLSGTGNPGTLSVDAYVDVEANAHLVLLGTIDNNGTIYVADPVESGGTLLINGTVTLDGSGAVTLGGGLAAISGVSGTEATLDNASTIEGAGHIGGSGLTLDNETGGIINADVDTAGDSIAFATGMIITNAGTIEATDGGRLSFTSDTITNTEQVDIDGTSGMSSIIIDGTLTLQSTTGTATTTGTGTVVLSGQGEIVSDLVSGHNDILHNVDNTISGDGTIGDADLTLHNDQYGVIDANSDGNTLTLQPASITNAGTIEATDGGTLAIGTLTVDNTTVTNTGTVEADAATGSTLALYNATIDGGTVDIQGILNSNGTSAIDGATYDNAGHTNVVTGTLTIDPTTVTNTGTIEVDSGATLDLSGVTLDGGTIIDNGTLVIGSGDTFEDGVTISGDGAVDINSSVTGTFILSPQFSGTISGLSAGNILTDLTYSSDEHAVWTPAAASASGSGSGTLTIYDGTTPEQSLALDGHYAQDNFAVTDASGKAEVAFVPGSGLVGEIIHPFSYPTSSVNDAVGQTPDATFVATDINYSTPPDTDSPQTTVTQFLDYSNQSDASTVSNTTVADALLGNDPAGTGTYFQLDGYVALTGDVTYTFRLNSDDGSTLTINGNELISDDGQHGADQFPTATFTPETTGSYPIEIRYFENDGGPAALHVQYEADGGGFVDLTSAVLFQQPLTPVTIDCSGALTISAPAADNVMFAGSTGALVLDQPDTFVGQITDFSGSDTIDLGGINYGSSQFSYNCSTGLLTVTDGSNTVSFAFVNLGGSLGFASDESGTGTLITDPSPTAPATAEGAISLASAGSADAYSESVSPEGSGYVGAFSLNPVSGSDGGASVSWEFNLGNDQINLARGETLTQSYGILVADGQNTLVNQTISVSIGGPGNDNFVFAPGIGADTIVNFNAQADTIDLSHFANIQSLQQVASAIVSDAHGDAVIELGHNDSITLPGVTANYLQQHLQSMVHVHA